MHVQLRCDANMAIGTVPFPYLSQKQPQSFATSGFGVDINGGKSIGGRKTSNQIVKADDSGELILFTDLRFVQQGKQREIQIVGGKKECIGQFIGRF